VDYTNYLNTPTGPDFETIIFVNYELKTRGNDCEPGMKTKQVGTGIKSRQTGSPARLLLAIE
jgi:hypothetical protein